jgi:hypothetical protein
VLETRTDAPEIATSLATLSTFYADNTPAARRQLRSTIENEGVKVNEQFLEAAERVIAALDTVQADLNAVAQCCDRMTAGVADSRAATSDMLLETDRLQRALALSETRSQLVGKFLEQYQLSPAEADALRADVISEAFFSALDHVRAIHGNCRSLLRTHHQRAGLELLDTMGALQEGAYERLCRWVQAECRALSELDAPEVNPLLQRAAASLRERQVLYKYCAEEVAAARHTALFQRFIRALTRGARPIEMHAPDPWRYVNDMMAWVHTSLASEREFLVSLFGDDPAAAAAEGGGSGADDAPSIPRLLDSVFESICRPLRVRIEQVLMSSPPPLLCFRLSQLLTFYVATADAMLGLSSQLSDSLRACHAMAMRTLSEQLKQRGDKLARYPPSPPRDLAPPAALEEGARLLADLVASYESSLDVRPGGSADAADVADFDAVLAAVAAPLAEAAERSSEALNPRAISRLDDGAHMDPADQRVYVLNCLQALRAPLEGHACAAARLEQLDQAVQGQVSALVATEVGRTLAACGLGEISERLALYRRGRERDVAGTPASDPALSLDAVAGALRTFFGRLSDPATLPEFRKLQVPDAKAHAAQQVLAALADAYAAVHDALADPGSGYPAAEVARAVKHTPEQVRTLLGVS